PVKRITMSGIVRLKDCVFKTSGCQTVGSNAWNIHSALVRNGQERKEAAYRPDLRGQVIFTQNFLVDDGIAQLRQIEFEKYSGPRIGIRSARAAGGKARDPSEKSGHRIVVVIAAAEHDHVVKPKIQRRQ